MKGLGVKGGPTEMIAISHVFKLPVYVYTVEYTTVHGFETPYKAFPREEDPVDDDKNLWKALRLQYTGKKHYNTIEPISV